MTKRAVALLCFSIFAGSQVQSATLSLAVQGAAQEDGAYVVYAGEQFQIKLTVRDGADIIGQVSLPGIDKLTVANQTSSQEISISGGKTTSEKNFLYDVQASSEGLLAIGPAQAMAGTKKISSNKLALRVLPTRPQQRKQFGTTVATELSLERSDVVIGEPIVLTISFYFDGPIGEVALDIPQFSSFLVKEIREQVTAQSVMRDGAPWQVVHRRVLLFPLSAGEKTIEPARVVYDVPQANHGMYDNPFAAMFGRRFSQHESFSKSLPITVSPLPPTSKKIVGVGQFATVSLDVDEAEAAVGEPVTARLTITGAGNFDQLRAPKLNLPTGTTAYDSQSNVQALPALGPAGGSKEFTYLLQASKSGKLVVPAQEFTYFDTLTRTYETLSTEPMALAITGEVVPAAPAALMPPATQRKQNSETPTPNFNVWYLALLLLTPLFFVRRLQVRAIMQNLKRRARALRGLDTPRALARAELCALEKEQNIAGVYNWLCLFIARSEGVETLETYLGGLQDHARRNALEAFARRAAHLAYGAAALTEREKDEFFAAAKKLLHD